MIRRGRWWYSICSISAHKTLRALLACSRNGKQLLWSGRLLPVNKTNHGPIWLSRAHRECSSKKALIALAKNLNCSFALWDGSPRQLCRLPAVAIRVFQMIAFYDQFDLFGQWMSQLIAFFLECLFMLWQPHGAFLILRIESSTLNS